MLSSACTDWRPFVLLTQPCCMGAGWALIRWWGVIVYICIACLSWLLLSLLGLFLTSTYNIIVVAVDATNANNNNNKNGTLVLSKPMHFLTLTFSSLSPILPEWAAELLLIHINHKGQKGFVWYFCLPLGNSKVRTGLEHIPDQQECAGPALERECAVILARLDYTASPSWC